MASSFWWPAAILKLSRNPPRGASLKQKMLLSTQEIPRDLGALCQELELRPNIRTKEALSISITQEITMILGAVCQELGTETKKVFIMP